MASQSFHCGTCECDLTDEMILAIHLAASHDVGPSYETFLKSKAINHPSSGIDVTEGEINPLLFQFQKDIVRWALRKGRAAIFADCGLGKTFMQLEWAKHVPGDVLILAPLAVSHQTVKEGQKLGVVVRYSRSGLEESRTITNYQMLHKFSSEVVGVVLDESSIIKHFEGKFRNEIIDKFKDTPYKLACTATPAPNDFMELGNHSEFLGNLTRTEMLSTFFVHDGGDTAKWRLKGHAERDFWKWVCSWAIMMRKPSDLGYDDEQFILPKLRLHERIVEAEVCTDGMLFPMPAQTLLERRQARAGSVEERADEVAAIVSKEPKQQWLIWCNLNIESSEAAKRIPGSIEVRGDQPDDYKEAMMMAFSRGEVRCLITKTSIAGFGMNWQQCARQIFFGLSDSWEAFYQGVRRIWRFGQKREVDCYIVTSSQEGAVLANIKRKEADANRMAEEMVNNMHELNQQELKGQVRKQDVYAEEIAEGRDWTMYLGDCVENIRKLEGDSIHYSIFSPPFASLYTYSASDRDMGNCRTHSEFFEHLRFLGPELLRVLKPGRLMSFHCMDLPTSKERDGVIGLTDFRGQLLKLFQDCGFIYHSSVTIWKDPVTAMQRTKALGLLHKQLKKDSCMSRQGIADYLVTMRKPGDNPERVTHTNESFPVQVWQRYASPVWMDINPSDTLQKESAREDKDERHICPLQLEVIRRGLELWTNPGDIVLSPFAGIGSEGYESIRMKRKFVGMELKRSYYVQACENLKAAQALNAGLFE